MELNLSQVLAWVQAGQVLVTAGVATATTIKTWMAAQHPGIPDAELDTICVAIIAGATRHRDLADGDRGLPFGTA